MLIGLAIGKMIPFPGRWQLADGIIINLSPLPPMLSYTTKGKTFWQPEIWRVLAATSLVTLSRPENDSTYSVLACLPSPYTNNSKKLHIQMNYSGGPNIVYCEAYSHPA